MRKNHDLNICPACGTEYHPNPAFLGWKRRYCSDACREARSRLDKEQKPMGKERMMNDKFIKATYQMVTLLAIFGFAFGLTALIGVIILAFQILPH